MRPAPELAAVAAAIPAGPVVSYCNTGHWASTNWFVLSELLGRKDVRLYYGSMVEWTADARRPVESGAPDGTNSRRRSASAFKDRHVAASRPN